MKAALLFPGQGSQTPGFLHKLPDHPSVQQTLAEASAAIGCNVLTLDDEIALRKSGNVQTAMTTSGVAFGRALAWEGVVFAVVAGHSVGVFAAAVIAGAVELEPALNLVRLRAQLMERDTSLMFAMIAIDGLSISLVDRLIADSEVRVAVRNAPQQFVLVGPVEALKPLVEKAKIAGATRITTLDVPTASHHPALRPAANELMHAARNIPFAHPRIPVLSNRTGRPLRTADAVREELAFNMAEPVLWNEVLQTLTSLSSAPLVETPPGHRLSQLAHAAFPHTPVFAATDMRFDSLLQRLQRFTDERDDRVR